MTRSRAVLIAVIVAFSLSFGFRSYVSPEEVSRTPVPARDSIITPAPAEWQVVYDSLGLEKQGLSADAFRYAWLGFKKMNLANPVMAIADFSQSSCKKRLYVVDLIRKKLIYHTYVAHGRNSGQEYAKQFSNADASYQSSLGFYRTLGTYQGKHGLSLRLEGVEKGINDRALQRAIVMHGADYVSEDFIKSTGRLGRSLGCPAVSVADAGKLIKMLYNGAGLFIYSLDPKYTNKSTFLASLMQTDQTETAPRLYTSAK